MSDIKKASATALALAEYARDRADEGGVTRLDLKQYVLSWMAGSGMHISTSEIVQRMIAGSILVKSGMLGDESRICRQKTTARSPRATCLGSPATFRYPEQDRASLWKAAD